MNKNILEFEVDVTEDDYLIFQKILPELNRNKTLEFQKEVKKGLRKTPHGIPFVIQWLFATLFFEALFVVPSHLFKIGHHKTIVVTVAIAVIIIPVFLHLGMKLFSHFSTSQTPERVTGIYSYKFTNDAMIVETKYGVFKHWWGFIDGLEETETDIYIRSGEEQYFLIPKHSLQPPHVLEEIKEFVSEKITVNTARRVCNQTE